ncbi:MAG: heavy-metal-associated domain-containing protein [Flavobacteriia bacterium]|nr:heavy-metal-associated domain-containing protein [Flavobacteriia bacterium]
MSITTKVEIVGMKCDGCVANVTRELSALNEVESVQVSLDEHTATIVSDGDIEKEQISSAVQKAGFSVK